MLTVNFGPMPKSSFQPSDPKMTNFKLGSRNDGPSLSIEGSSQFADGHVFNVTHESLGHGLGMTQISAEQGKCFDICIKLVCPLVVFL